MKRNLLLFVLAVIIIFPVSAQKGKTIVPAVPETAGFSTERLKRIDNAMNEWVKNGWMNGEKH